MFETKANLSKYHMGVLEGRDWLVDASIFVSRTQHGLMLACAVVCGCRSWNCKENDISIFCKTICITKSV